MNSFLDVIMLCLFCWCSIELCRIACVPYIYMTVNDLFGAFGVMCTVM